MQMIFLITFFVIQHLRFYNVSNILQNQFYDLKRYIIYRLQGKKVLIFKLIYFVLVTILFLYNHSFCLLFPFVFIEKESNKIKQFKYTSRIKRQFIFFEFFNLLNFVFLFIAISQFVIFVYNFLFFWISFACSLICEKIIQQKFIYLAKQKLRNYNVCFIAITGSYGKTSCKNYIYELLKNKYNVLITPKSYNTLNGILLTINNNLKPYHDIFVAEFGVDKVKGMNKFIKTFNVDIGIVTTIGTQHLKTFKTFENIKKEKMKLLMCCKQKAIINYDDKNIDYKKVKCEQISFSINDNNADVCLLNYELVEGKTKMKIKICNNEIETYTTLLGKHNLANILCAIAVSCCFNINNNDIANSITKLKNIDHRLSTLKKGSWLIIDDSYNSNIIGFINALEVLKNSVGIRVLITPGIIEQGNNNNDSILSKAINDSCDLALLINNPSFSNLITNKMSFKSFTDAYNYLTYKYQQEKLTILIENDLPDIYIK